MNNEFTYELLDPEPGLEATLSESTYLKLPPAIRAKYIVQEEKEDPEGDTFNSNDAHAQKDLEDQYGLGDEDIVSFKKITLPRQTDYDQLEQFNATFGQVRKGYNDDED